MATTSTAERGEKEGREGQEARAGGEESAKEMGRKATILEMGRHKGNVTLTVSVEDGVSEDNSSNSAWRTQRKQSREEGGDGEEGGPS